MWGTWDTRVGVALINITITEVALERQPLKYFQAHENMGINRQKYEIQVL